MTAGQHSGSERAKRLLKSELKKKGFTYAALAEVLRARGIMETEAKIRNKVSRGSFTAAFMIQCFDAIGSKSISLAE